LHLSYVFPECVAYGSGGGPEFNTTIYEADNGDRSAFVPWPIGRHKYDASSGVKKISEFETILTLYHVARGRADTFDWQDRNDHKSCLLSESPSDTDQILGVGDGIQTDFGIYKEYTVGLVTRRRPIQRPLPGSVLIAADGVPVTTGWSWIESEFVIRFDVAPLTGVALTCGYLFHVPVAFASNVLKDNFTNKSGDDFLVEFPIDLEEVKLKSEDFPP